MEIELNDIFKQNPYNIDKAQIKVGDLFWANSRIMYISNKVTKTKDSFFDSIHGKPLFKMKELLSDSNREWILYESYFTDSLDYLAPVTDEDIAHQLALASAYFHLTGEVDLWLPDYEGAGVCISKKNEGTISLTFDELLVLRNKLDQILK